MKRWKNYNITGEFAVKSQEVPFVIYIYKQFVSKSKTSNRIQTWQVCNVYGSTL
jgi:hypothetical protein